MDYGKAIGGGLIGAAVGAIVWLATSFVAGSDLGFFGAVVGFLVGGGVRLLNKAEKSPSLGVVALLIALVCTPVTKFIAYQAALQKQLGQITSTPSSFTEEDMIVREAIAVAGESVRAGKKLVWPAGKNSMNAKTLADFPEEVAKEAQNRWNALPTTQRDRKKADAEASDRKIREGEVAAKQRAAGNAFSLMDLIYLAISVGGAYLLGAGTIKGGGEGDDEGGGFSTQGSVIRASDA